MSDFPPPTHDPDEPPVGSGRPLPHSDPKKPGFDPESLDRTIIAIPLLRDIREEKIKAEEVKETGDPVPPARKYDVIVDANLEFSGGRQEARERIHAAIKQITRGRKDENVGVDAVKSRVSQQYVFARLTGDDIQELARLDGARARESRGARTIYRIWPDFPIRGLISKSVSTVKADAARVSFSAYGHDIIWAVLDSGIDKNHPHFARHGNLEVADPLQHTDFTAGPGEQRPLVDEFGHGTHVAGIIAGELRPEDVKGGKILGAVRVRSESGEVERRQVELPAVSGMAPRCKLVSYKVLNENGEGLASSLIAALETIQEVNGHGRRVLIHGVNLSVGYDFQPEWFACGQSPLCVEVDRLVRSGVVVVAAAGNTGYGFEETEFRGTVASGIPLSINDPGNAEMAITVGSTHRDAPHIYGVSYFSSKGPTGDGRIKPDMVAPGEKILSCAAGKQLEDIPPAQRGEYLEQSGTSMAAPHVSGVIAAFLSVRREFINQPERVKQIFLDTATDLRRDRYFQGHGLVDLMRAIQSI
jgi:serine protease AprX